MSMELCEIGQTPFQVRAELALRTLRDRIMSHVARETLVRRACTEWQENLLTRTDLLRQQIQELEARLSPWMRRQDLKLSVVSQSEDNR
jgi:hypothetical protein